MIAHTTIFNMPSRGTLAGTRVTSVGPPSATAVVVVVEVVVIGVIVVVE